MFTVHKPMAGETHAARIKNGNINNERSVTAQPRTCEKKKMMMMTLNDVLSSYSKVSEKSLI